MLMVECVFCLQLHLMVLHDYGVSKLARLSVNTVAIKKQLFVLHSVTKYLSVNSLDENHYA